jgi:integrase
MASRVNPLPDTIESIPGFPSTLKIYKIPASRFWQMRAWMDKRFICRSTKSEVHSEAVNKAKRFYNELLLKASQNQPLTQASTFKKAADALLEEDRGRVARGERKQSVVDDCVYILEKDLLPYFQNIHVKDVSYKRITEYVETLKKRNLSSQTIKNHFMHLRKILKQAWKLEMITAMPIFPTISVSDNPREWFNEEQYETLQKTIRKAIRDNVVIRLANRRLLPPITEELLDLSNFMVNSFLRPQDIKILQNKHISVIKKPDRIYLRIMAKGKTAPAPVISTQAAVTIYQRIKGDPEEYVFFPGMNRDHAQSTMARQFKYVLEQANLKKGDDGQERTLYSLRHTCIMNQLLSGKWPIMTLAKNCRTSVEMIQRFYGSHLEAEMNVAGMAQQVESGADLEDFFEDDPGT